jgi:GTPase Era involved in 16S rRNA processing
MSLDYTKTLQQLGRDLEALIGFAHKLDLNKSAALLEDVVSRMREHKFTVAVVGEFKTGKSTFVNALLGVDVVPTDVIPATATLNRITFGLDSSIEVIYKDGHKDRVAFDELERYVTKEHVTEDLLASVDEVVVHHHAPYLLNNVDVIDTPGLNDEDAMTSVTLSVLPRADAAILVISAMAPLSEYTRDFLENKLLSADLGRVLFLVNRIGQLGDPGEAGKLLAHVEKRITENVVERARAEYGDGSAEFEAYVKKIGKPRVFGMDSYQALQAQLRNDGELLEKSRFPEFSAGLRTFLNEDRGAIVLQVPVNRALAAANETLLALEMRQKALSLSGDEFTAKYNEAAQELEKLSERRAAELQAVEKKQAATLRACLAHARGVEDRMRRAMLKDLDAVGLTGLDVSGESGQQEAIQKLRGATQTAARRQAEKEARAIGEQVAKSVSEASGELHEFSVQVDDVMSRIAADFTQTMAGGAIAGSVSINKQSGWADAVAVILSLLSWFSSDKSSRYLLGDSRAKSFKEHFKSKLSESIGARSIEEQMRQSVENYVREAFEGLQEKVSRDLEALIADTRRTLDDLRRGKERHEFITTEELRMYSEMAEKTRSIRDFASRVNAALTERTAVEETL